MTSSSRQSAAPEDDPGPSGIDTSVAHVARVCNYWLGGKDSYATDREAGDEAIRAHPDMVPLCAPTGHS